jgi:hypothetical protein
MTMWPEEEWQNQKVFGKEIKVADLDSALHDLQMKAMKMEPGTVPNNDYWEDVLGHDKPSKHANTGDAIKKAAAPANSGGRPIGKPNGTPTAAEPERGRPSRGRKRHYDDNSFVGYGEGYADDDEDAAFYSNSEGTGKKKRKKVCLSYVLIHFNTDSFSPTGSRLEDFHSAPGQRGQLWSRHVWNRGSMNG